jgi:glycosyltransferase involved in cell wall biosynthesis
MQVSFILSSLQLSGGVRVVIQYANRLSNRGHIVSLITPDGTIDPEMRDELIPAVKVVATQHKIAPNPNIFQLLRISCEMILAVPKSDVIVATHTPTTALSFVAGKLLRRGRIVWFYQDYLEMFETKLIEKWLIRNALRWHDIALTISDASVQELRSFLQTIKVIKVGEGLDTENIFHPSSDIMLNHSKSSEKITILTIADPRPRKGMADFLSAIEKVYTVEKDIILWIVSKENMNIQTDVPYEYFFRPSLPELANLYSACDLFISASWYESFGLPPLEAMACGAAVITTDSRGINEFAVDGENCIIVPPQNPEILASAIQNLLHDQSLMNKIKQKGPITASKFDWNIATDRFEAALRQAVMGK